MLPSHVEHDGTNRRHDILEPSYTMGEELANAITHGIGALLSVAGLVILIVFAVIYGDVWHVVSCSIFGASLIMLYTASTLYHSFQGPRVKRFFRIMDHVSIYLLIAGTYTPFALVNLRGPWGWTLFGIIWGLTLFGIFFKVAFIGRFRVVSTIIYLAMGWLVIVAVKPVVELVAPGGLMLMAAGGLAYTLGVVFYAWKIMPFHHAVWHLFVLAGSAFHYFAVLFFVIPMPA